MNLYPVQPLEDLFEKYERKLVSSGLTEAGTALFGFLDDELIWSRVDGPAAQVLTSVFDMLSINSLLFAQPIEPYRTIIDFLTAGAPEAIRPEDCETRTFLHTLPVLDRFESDAVISALKTRKSVIIPGFGIVTTGTVSLEQAFVSFASVCFACFVKFFVDYLGGLRRGFCDRRHTEAMDRVKQTIDSPHGFDEPLMTGPFQTEAEIRQAMVEAGRHVVNHRLVDSFFGNISYRFNDTIYISQTGSSLDELESCIDACPMDGSSCNGITASSEFSAHWQIVADTGCRAVLHGHPKFTVILSMDCDDASCENRGSCHQSCPRERSACGIPIVPGEVGRGDCGLWKTVPAAIAGKAGAIVHGHGLFTTGDADFNRPFKSLVSIENSCRQAYFRRVAELLAEGRGQRA